LSAPIALAQIESNGTLPIAPQPPNSHYPARLISTAGGKSFGYLLLGLANLDIIYELSSGD
jgi:hypothetical protein